MTLFSIFNQGYYALLEHTESMQNTIIVTAYVHSELYPNYAIGIRLKPDLLPYFVWKVDQQEAPS
jgi:hypothetical protein